MRLTNFKFFTGVCILMMHSMPALAQENSTRATDQGYGVYFEETFFPVYVDRNDTRSVTDTPGVATETGLGYDLRTTLGYVWDDMVLVGLTYYYYNLKTKRGDVTGGDTGLDESTISSRIGPTAGWLWGGLRVLLTWWMGGNRTVSTRNFDNTGDTGDVTITNSGIKGYQFLVGYTFELGAGFEIGPSLVYSNVSYKRQSKRNRLNSAEDYSGTTLYSPAIDNGISPMVSVLFRF